MAINYTSLFTPIGENLKWFYHTRNIAVGASSKYPNTAGFTPAMDLVQALTQLQADYDTAARYDVFGSVPGDLEAFKDVCLEQMAYYEGKIEALLTNREGVLQQINGLTDESGIEDVLQYMYRDMSTNSEHVLKCTATVPSIGTANSGNNGDEECHCTVVLDGVTPPWVGGPSHLLWTDVNSELVSTSETVMLECIADSETDGLPEGAEKWKWTGMFGSDNLHDWRGEGSGAGPELTTSNGENLLTNGEFEDFVANQPTGWTVTGGAVGVNIFSETTTMKRGDACLKFLQAGAVATLSVEQSIPEGLIAPDKRYFVAIWVKGEAGIAAGALTIHFEGENYTAGGTEEITMNAAALAAATSWTLKKFWITFPYEVPEDLKMVIKITGTLTNAKNVYFDGFVVAPVNYHGGFGVNIVAAESRGASGTGKILRGDRFTIAVSNDNAGYIQTYFRRKYKFQLNSHATPTLANTLVTT